MPRCRHHSLTSRRVRTIGRAGGVFNSRRKSRH
jgi:hypothetical protein